jgi:hypothetical protein
MLPLDITAIEQHARRLRAEEMHRVQGLMSAQMRLYGQLMGATLLSALINISDGLFVLFSWNPVQAVSRHAARHLHPALLTRLNRLARRLFSWNPQPHRS